mgnify:CR=1 FL=1
MHILTITSYYVRTKCWIFINSVYNYKYSMITIQSFYAREERCTNFPLIEKAGCKGMKNGGASVSVIHSNFIINTGEATALDIRLSASVQSSSSVKVFFRTTSVEDVRKLGDVPWRAFNTDGNADTLPEPSKTDNDFKEFKFK